MYLGVIALLLITCILGAPTEHLLARGSAALDPKVVDQGDGFYLAKFDNVTGLHHVEFTPMAELIKRTGVMEPAVESSNNLIKRDGITCSGRATTDVSDLDTANRHLATNANNHGQYEKHDWGWVHLSSETSFFCNYQRNYLTYNIIIDMEIDVSRNCLGSPFYGFERLTNKNTIQDLSVGRTFRDDVFCDGQTHGT